MGYLPVLPRYMTEAFPTRGLRLGSGWQEVKNEKPAEWRAFVDLSNLRENGAGEGIRTLDPNLGKVVLYP
jgi:hypothetical protein